KGPAHHLPRGDRPREPPQGRGHSGVPRTLRRRGGLRGLAQAVPGQGRRGPAAGRPRHPEHLGCDDQRSRRDRRRAAYARRAHRLAPERSDPMRYADPRFAWLLEASSALLALTFYIQSYLILRDLARVRREEAVR